MFNMAFQEVFDGSDMFMNTNPDFEIHRTKCHRLEYQRDEFSNTDINKSQGQPKFSEILSSSFGKFT